MLSTFVGADSAAFERQCFALGVRNRCRTLALAIDESTLERIGDFERLPTEANSALVARYRRTYGPWAPPLSTLTESVYEALHLYAAATRRAGDDDPRAVARELRAGRFELPRGTVTMTGPDTVQQRLYLADATEAGLMVASVC